MPRSGAPTSHARQLQRARGRQLEAVRRLQVRDPHRAVDGRAAHGAVPRSDDLARPPTQRVLAVDAEQMERLAADAVEHARVALGGADPAHDDVGLLRRPVDRALRLPDQRPRAPGDARIGVVERTRRDVAGGHVADRLHDGVDGRATHLVAVQAALARLAHRERTARPDVAAVHLVRRLQHRDAPAIGADLDRPVERRRAAVADRARVHDQAAVAIGDRGGDDRLEHRADDQLGPVAGDGGLHLEPGRDHRDGDLVALLAERDLRALAQAVVSGDEEQDAHQEDRRQPAAPYSVGASTRASRGTHGRRVQGPDRGRAGERVLGRGRRQHARRPLLHRRHDRERPRA